MEGTVVMAAPPKILVVEDETLLADALGKALRREDMIVDVRYDGRTALERLESQPIDVVVLDRDTVSYTHLTLPTM